MGSFTATEIVRLKRAKEAYNHGTLNDFENRATTLRLRFMLYLYRTGQLHEQDAPIVEYPESSEATDPSKETIDELTYT